MRFQRNQLAGWRRLGGDERGGSTVLVALGMTAVLGTAALAVDYARGLTARQALSSAADVAALAAASRLPDKAAARQTAIEYIEKNLPRSQHGQVLDPEDIDFGTWDPGARKFYDDDGAISGGGTTDTAGFAKTASFSGGGGSSLASAQVGGVPAVRVTTRMAGSNGNPMGTLFAWILGSSSVEIGVSAVAGRGGPPCIVSLDPTSSAAMSLSGTASVNAIGCGVQVNSTASRALEIKGSAQLNASDICVSGSVTARSDATSPEPNEYCPAMKDPMAGLEKPDVGACDYIDLSLKGATTTLDPGVYCGGLDIGAGSDVALSPGLYVMQDGPLAVAAKSTLSGSEVTIFLTGDEALLSFKSKSIINLTAPKSGGMEGVLLFQDPDFGGTHDWKGKSTTSLRGVIYFPSGTLNSKNENAITPLGSCVVLIANKLEFDANSGASVDITQSNCRNALPGPYSRGIVLLD